MPTTISGTSGIDKIVDNTVTIADLQNGSLPIGTGQAWYDMRSQRELNVTYTNNTGRSIVVSFVSVGSSTTIGNALVVDNIQIAYMNSLSNMAAVFSGIVPPGSTYRINGSGITTWAELR